MSENLKQTPTPRVGRRSFLKMASLAAVAGVLIGIYYNAIDPLMGLMPGIKAFVAAVFGGIGILPGRPGSGAFPHCWLVLADSCLGRCRGFMAACHANHPCSIQGPCWPTAENAQAS